MNQIDTPSIAHLTKHKENLIGILNDCFKIFYCSERIETYNVTRIVGIPMVSFTELPIINQDVLLKAYGEYGLTMNRNWAIKNKLNPILYLESTSSISQSFEIIIKNAFKENMVRIVDGTEYQKASMDFLRFTKNFRGLLIRRGKVENNNYPFYLEREWRFVIDFQEVEKMFIPYYEYEDEEQRTITNQNISDRRLVFEEKDIENLIVKDESEIEELKLDLNKLKGNKYSEEDIESLKSKIIISKYLLHKMDVTAA